MNWNIAGSAFAGGIISAIFITVLLALMLYFEDRVKAKQEPEKVQKPRTLHDDLLERHLEELIVANFNGLFPGWTIYQVETDNTNGVKLPGVRYRTPAGEIDILCADQNNKLVVIELKRNRTPDQVVTQVNRYIAWVDRHVAQSGQTVRGIIIAKKHSDHVIYSASRNGDIELWTYDLNLTLQPFLPKDD